MPCYFHFEHVADNTNYFFRMDRGFVAQTAEINGGRTAPMSAMQQASKRQKHSTW